MEVEDQVQLADIAEVTIQAFHEVMHLAERRTKASRSFWGEKMCGSEEYIQMLVRYPFRLCPSSSDALETPHFGSSTPCGCPFYPKIYQKYNI